jgi:hypothetical protein
MRHTATRYTARLALVTLTAAASMLVSGVGGAAAAPAATAQATAKCWVQVINDWLDNSRVDGTYAIPCYTQAIQQLNKYPDVRYYSSAADDIHRALLAAFRQDRGSGGGGSQGPNDRNGPGGGVSPAGGGPGDPPKSGGGLWRSIANHVGPSDAQSIPLPLLVLGGLALLLLATAGATWLTRRLQARRMPPRPAVKRP